MHAATNNGFVVEDPNIPLVTSQTNSTRYTMYTISRQLSSKANAAQSTSPSSAGDALRRQQMNSNDGMNALKNVGYRLAKRRELFRMRRVICDFTLAFAIIGICFMVFETECILLGYYTKQDFASFVVKACISVSTLILLCFDIWYHVLETQIIMVDNTLDDWRMTVTVKRVLLICLELLVYTIHPIPGYYKVTVSTFETNSANTKYIVVPIDIFMSIPMVLRVHLVARALMLHSQLYMNASSQSLGALNRIHFNIKFVFKSLMDLQPGLFVFTISFCVFILASWFMWACESTHYNSQATILNSAWLVAITFLTIGYGDIVPTSYCGRTISVLTGLLGAGCTALIVALLTRTLQLSRSERYVHDFVIDIALEKRRKIVAANMVKYCWRSFKCRQAGKMEQARRYKRLMFVAVQMMRDIRLSRRSLVDKSVTLVELNKSQSATHDSIVRMEATQRDIESRMSGVESRLTSLDSKMDILHNLLSDQQ